MDTKIDYDEKIMGEIKSKISSYLCDKKANDDEWAFASLQYCVALIEDLADENNSLWFMLEEMKRSKWTKENSVELDKAIQKQLTMLKFMQSTKGEA